MVIFKPFTYSLLSKLLNESKVNQLLKQHALLNRKHMINTLACGEEKAGPEFVYTSTLIPSVLARMEYVKSGL